jgi:hypothetical protein
MELESIKNRYERLKKSYIDLKLKYEYQTKQLEKLTNKQKGR